MQTTATLILGAAFLLVVPTTVSASPADTTRQAYRVTLEDGSMFVGTIASSTPDSVVVQTGSGLILTLPRRTVKQIERLRGTIVKGEYQRVDPNGSRLLFGATARPLMAGEGYFAAYEIFFPYAAVGITDFFSLGGGVSLLPGAPNQAFYLAPKLALTTKDEMFSVALGALYITTFSSSENPLGVLYGAGTYGTPRAGVTLGLGYGYSQDEFDAAPLVLLGGELQLSNSVKLVTENWFALGTPSRLLSFGCRFFGDDLSADVGFFYPVENGSVIDEGFPLVPWLGFAYNFGS